VSCVLGLSEAAIARLATLTLQEEVLDELDRLADDPSGLRVRGVPPTAVHDFTRAEGDVVHYVFAHIEPDVPANTLRVLAIGLVTRHVT